MLKYIKNIYLISILLCLISGNAFLLIIAITTLYISFRLLYRPYMPNFLFWGVFMQWISASIELFYASWLGITMKELFVLYRTSYVDIDLLDKAIMLNLVGILFFVVGCSLSIGKINGKLLKLQENIKALNTKKYMIFYLIYSLFTVILSQYLFTFSGLTQLFSFFVFLKWGLLYLLIYAALQNWKKYWFLTVGIILFELLMGLGSFFAASIVNLCLFSLFAGLSMVRFFSIRLVINTVVFAFVLVNFAVIWTSVKTDYRTFLTSGRKTQIVDVERSEAVTKLLSLSFNIDAESYQEGSIQLIKRIGYFSFISRVLRYVPEQHPHENGAILINSFTFYLTPRIFFPDKQVIDDSEHTSKYLGVFVSGRETGTSISLGYIADAYIDFGLPFMFISPLLLGVIIGASCNFLMNQTTHLFWRTAIYGMYFSIANINGTNTIKVTGPIIITLIIGYFFLNYIAPSLQKVIGYR